jgi:hypothetical protein
MGAIVNRDLQQRIRPVNGLTGHQHVAKSDIKSAAKIIQNFDNRWNLWDDVEEPTKPVSAVFCITVVICITLSNCKWQFLWMVKIYTHQF